MEDYNKENPFSPNNPGVAITKAAADKLAINLEKTNSNNKRKAVFFSKSTIKKLLDNKKATGLRVYFGADNDSNLEAILVSVDIEGENIFQRKRKPSAMAKSTSTDVQSQSSSIEEDSIYISNVPCPSMCPKGSGIGR